MRFPLPQLVVVLLSLGQIWSSGLPVTAAEAPVAAEKNPPGDIPDSQVFISYAGPGFSMQVPEGWSRQDAVSGARFSDKYNIIEVSIADAPTAPTVASAKAGAASELGANGHAVKISGINEVKLEGGPAVRIDYASNSEPNPVTNKQIRLERVRYLYFSGGKQITLDMAAPLGADNVDQWRLMANSVRFN
jgi:hypothetical protein